MSRSGSRERPMGKRPASSWEGTDLDIEGRDCVRINSRGFILAALLLASAGAFAQIKESISVNVVEVPVTVIDGSGNPVRGLTAANFKLLDNGKERAISSFDTIDFGASTSPEIAKTALAKMH